MLLPTSFGKAIELVVQLNYLRIFDPLLSGVTGSLLMLFL